MHLKLPGNLYGQLFVGKRRILLVGVLFVMVATNSYADFESSKIRQYGVAQGLPSDQVYDVLSDQQGYLWFATDRGVSRFDGYTFVNYSTANGLMSNVVFSLYEDQAGKIWCQGLSDALCYIDKGVVKEYKYNRQIKAWNIGSEVTTNLTFEKDTLFVYVVGKGYYWLSQEGNGLYFEYPYGKKTNDTGFLHWLTTGNEGEIAITSEPFRVENDTAYIRKMSRPGYTDLIHNLTAPWVVYDRRQKYIDDEGNKIWANDEAVYYFRNSTFTHKVFTKSKLVCVFKQTEGGYWMAHENDGVYRYEDPWEEHKANDHFFNNLTITAIEEDYEGGLWFTTLTQGVYYLPPGLDFIKEVPQSLPKTRIISLAAGKEELFIGYDNGEIRKLLGDNTVEHIKRSSFQSVQSGYNPFFYNENSDELVTIDELIYNYNKDKPYLIRKFSAQRKFNYTDEQIVPPVFISLLSDDKGGYYCATSCGLIHCKKGGVQDAQFYKYKKIGDTTTPVWCFRIDAFHKSNGSIDYVASNEGIFRLSGDTLHFLGDTVPALKGRFSCIVSDSANNFYFGSHGKGLVAWRQGETSIINLQNGLLGNEVRAISVERNNVIWVGTNNGVNRLSWSESGELDNIRLTTIHGLSSARVNVMLATEEYLFLGTDQGLVKLLKGAPEAIKAVPRIYLDSIKVNGQPVLLDSSLLLLDADANRLSFSFTSLAYKDIPGQVYEYQLEGLENTWNRTLNRSVQYDFLPYGDYVFNVRSVNNRGAISDVVTQAFKVQRPFWLQWWFLTIGCVLISLIIIVLVKRRERRIRKAMEDQRRIVELELKALRSQMNPHFTYNTMSAIQQFILNNTSIAASDYIADFASLIRKVLENSKEEIISLSGELETLALYLKLEKMRFESRLTYQIELDPSINAEAFYIPTMVIQPYVENAILHGILPASKEGKISITVTAKNNGILIILEDNGIGRKKAAEKRRYLGHKKNGLGMHITAERLNLIKRQVNSPYEAVIQDVIGEGGRVDGTRVQLFFSVNLNPYE